LARARGRGIRTGHALGRCGQAPRRWGVAGARLCAEMAQTELGGIGGRGLSRWELTPTEERVAALVAAGHANREVAAELFISVRTVDWNLRKIYAKLGIHSRRELAARPQRPTRG